MKANKPMALTADETSAYQSALQQSNSAAVPLPSKGEGLGVGSVTQRKQTTAVQRKAPEVRKNTDGGVNPRKGICQCKEAPRGRQRPKQFVIKLVRYSVTPSGLGLLMHLARGFTPPSGVSRAFGAY